MIYTCLPIANLNCIFMLIFAVWLLLQHTPKRKKNSPKSVHLVGTDRPEATMIYAGFYHEILTSNKDHPIKLTLISPGIHTNASFLVGQSSIRALENRGRQFKKVLLLKTFFNRFWPKSNWSTKHFSFDLNLEQHSGLKVRGSEINFII